MSGNLVIGVKRSSSLHLTHPLTLRAVGAPQMIPQLPPFFSVLHCPLELRELQACPFPDVVFPSLLPRFCCRCCSRRLDFFQQVQEIKIKTLNRAFSFEMLCCVYFQLRNLLVSVTISGTRCGKHRQVSQVALRLPVASSIFFLAGVT